MANKPKDKGRRFEHKVKDTFLKHNVYSERIPLSGSIGGKYDSDVIVGTTENIHAKIECKHRENISKQLWGWLEGNDYLAVQRNGTNFEPLMILPLKTFVKMYHDLHPESRLENFNAKVEDKKTSSR